MGAGASVPPHDDGQDLATFAAVHREYERLCGARPPPLDADPSAPDAPPSDEEMFARLRGVLAAHYRQEHVETKEGAPLEGIETAAIAKADDVPIGEQQGDASGGLGDEVETTATTTVDNEAGEDVATPLTAESLLKLADSLPDDGDDGSRPLKSTGSTHESLASLSEGSFGRSFSSSSRSAMDLTQNLTPVFTTDVLTDPTTLKMILTYCERNKVPHGVDKVRFWVEIDELALLPSHSYTNRRLRKIYDKFLSPEAAMPVCVTKAMLQEIERALDGESISAGIYAEAQAICFTALEKSVYPRFRESKLFRKMQEFCAPAGAHAEGHELPPTEEFTLVAILEHPAKLRFLKTYCMEALALENLLFYLEVEDCKRLPNLSFISNKTRRIYDRYCAPGSRNFIDIDPGALAELHATAEAKQVLFPKLFYEAQVIVFQHISEDVWRGFCRTQEYLEYSKRIAPERKQHQPKRHLRFASAEQSEDVQHKLEAMNEFQLIEMAMHYPVVKLIPIQYRIEDEDGPRRGSLVLDEVAQEQQLTPDEQLTVILGDAFAKKYFKQFMKVRGVDQYLAFCEEVEDFKLLPGIEFLQHSAKKIYRKYIVPSAKLQVDMSTAMRDEISERLRNPSVDMFKKISMRVRHGMLQDSLPRFVKSGQYSELKKLAKQFKEVEVENELKAIDAAAKKGKLELTHLDMLLQNQLCIKQFRLFLESQHCSENLMLWEEIEHFRRLPSYQIVIRSARKIYDKYLNPNTSRNNAALVALPAALHGRVVSQLEVASRTTFDEVELECRDMMRNVVLPDFLDSRIFMALVGTWAAVDDEYPAEMLRGEFEMAFLRHRFHLVQETKGLSRNSSTPSLESKKASASTTNN